MSKLATQAHNAPKANLKANDMILSLSLCVCSDDREPYERPEFSVVFDDALGILAFFYAVDYKRQ